VTLAGVPQFCRNMQLSLRNFGSLAMFSAMRQARDGGEINCCRLFARRRNGKGTGLQKPVSPMLGQHYPLVTTGGGALPLPTYCAQPAMLRRANIAAVARASFFIELSQS
jgi:hypothetical protein